MEAKGVEDGLFAECELKKMSIREFVEKGFLQEANRRFFHPLGLCLVVQEDTDAGDFNLAGIYDYRDDPEGCAYGKGSIFVDQPDVARRRIKSVQVEWDRHVESRRAVLGSEYQLIGRIPRRLVQTRSN